MTRRSRLACRGRLDLPSWDEFEVGERRAGLVVGIDREPGHDRSFHHPTERRAAEIKACYDERFCRMFEFCLIGAELAFRRQRQVVYQVQLVREQDALPLTRDYMLGPAAREATRSAPRALEAADLVAWHA